MAYIDERDSVISEQSRHQSLHPIHIDQHEAQSFSGFKSTLWHQIVSNIKLRSFSLRSFKLIAFTCVLETSNLELLGFNVMQQFLMFREPMFKSSEAVVDDTISWLGTFCLDFVNIARFAWIKNQFFRDEN